MKIIPLVLFAVVCQRSYTQTNTNNNTPVDKIILVSGSMSNDPPFIKYVAGLTKKSNPRICYVPTAGADNPYGISAWYANCVELHPPKTLV